MKGGFAEGGLRLKRVCRRRVRTTEEGESAGRGTQGQGIVQKEVTRSEGEYKSRLYLPGTKDDKRRLTKEVIQAGIKDGAEGAKRGTKDSGMRINQVQKSQEGGCKKVARRGQTRGLSEYGRGLPGRRVFTEHCPVGGGGTEAQTAVSYTRVARGLEIVALCVFQQAERSIHKI